MDELDEMLGRLAHASVHPGLATIETAVLATIAARSTSPARLTGRAVALATAGAVLMGVAGAAVPAATAQAQTALSPLGATDALAPSTLLGGDR